MGVPQLPPQLGPAGPCLSPPPPPPLPASAAAAAADEVDQWLAPNSSEEDGKDEGKQAAEKLGSAEVLGPVEGTLYCRRAAWGSEPPLADAAEAEGSQPVAAAPADGGVLRLRGGGSSGSRKRPASAGGGSDGGDAAKKARPGSAALGESEAERFGPEVVGRSVMVYWKEQKTYYTGTIIKYLPDSG